MFWFAIPLVLGVGAALLSDDDSGGGSGGDGGAARARRAKKEAKRSSINDDIAQYIVAQEAHLLEKYQVQVEISADGIEVLEKNMAIDEEVARLNNEIKEIEALISLLGREIA